MSTSSKSEKPMSKNPRFESCCERTLYVFEKIAVSGPVSLSRLIVVTEIPRVSVWRSLKTLERCGWIKARRFDHAFEASFSTKARFLGAHFAFEEAEQAIMIIDDLEILGELDVRVAMIDKTGQVLIIDGSKRRTNINIELSLADDILPAVCLLASPRLEAKQFLDSYCSSANTREFLHISSGDRLRELVQIGQNKIAWLEDKSGFAFPFVFSSFARGAVEIRSKSYKSAPRSKLVNLARMVDRDPNDIKISETRASFALDSWYAELQE